MQTHTQILTQAGILAEAIGRQIWVCQQGETIFASLAYVSGSTLIARVFGPGDYLMEE